MDEFSGARPKPAAPSDRVLSRQNRIAAVLLGCGYSPEEVAEELHLELTYLRILMRSKLFKIEMGKAQERYIKGAVEIANARFHTKTPRMMDIVEQMAEDPETPAPTRHAIARDYYNRVIPAKTEGPKQAQQVIINITASQADSIKATLEEVRQIEPGDCDS